MMPHQYPRSGGVSPVPSPLRSTYLGGGDASSVEPGGAPLDVRLTARGALLLGILAALLFGPAVWAVLWLVDARLFIAALAGVSVLLAAVCAVEIFRKK